MFVIKLLSLLMFAAFGRADDRADPKQQAMADISLGMQGLKEAASDPALLAQLMQDMAVSCAGRNPVHGYW